MSLNTLEIIVAYYPIYRWEENKFMFVLMNISHFFFHKMHVIVFYDNIKYVASQCTQKSMSTYNVESFVRFVNV